MNARHLNFDHDDRAARLDRVDARLNAQGMALVGLLAGNALSPNADHDHQITERLRAARVRAVAQRKRGFSESPALAPAASAGLIDWVKGLLGVRAPVSVQGLGSFSAGSATPSNDNDGLGWGSGIASVIPAIALVSALVVIHDAATEERATELAAVDAELLADDLPPSAYADPGFAQFLKQQR